MFMQSQSCFFILIHKTYIHNIEWIIHIVSFIRLFWNSLHILNTTSVLTKESSSPASDRPAFGRPAPGRCPAAWAAAVGVQRCTAPPRAPHAVYSRPDWRGASRPRDANPYARVRQVNLERTERCIQYRTLQKFTLIDIFGLIPSGGCKSDAEGGEAAVCLKMHFPTGARRRRCGPGGGCMRWWTSYWFLSGRSSLIVAVQGGIDRCTL